MEWIYNFCQLLIKFQSCYNYNIDYPEDYVMMPQKNKSPIWSKVLNFFNCCSKWANRINEIIRTNLIDLSWIFSRLNDFSLNYWGKEKQIIILSWTWIIFLMFLLLSDFWRQNPIYDGWFYLKPWIAVKVLENRLPKLPPSKSKIKKFR